MGRDIESLIGRIGNEELAQVVSALFVAGNYEQARQTAEGIGDPEDKARALKDIARAYARLGQWRQARQIAELNTTDDGRAIALAAILEAWAERRNPAFEGRSERKVRICLTPPLTGK